MRRACYDVEGRSSASRSENLVRSRDGAIAWPHHRRMRKWVIAVGTLLCCVSCRSVAPAPDPPAVVQRFLHAFNNLDIDDMRGLFAEDATAFLPFAAPATRVGGRAAIIQAIEPMFNADRRRASHGAPSLSLS